MSARLCLAALLLSYFLAQGSVALTDGFAVGNARGEVSSQVDTRISDSLAYTSYSMGSPIDGWLTDGSNVFGHGYIDQTRLYSGSSGYFGANYVHADDADLDLRTSGTLVPALASINTNANIIGTNIDYKWSLSSNSVYREVEDSVSSGSVNFAAGLLASSVGTSIGISADESSAKPGKPGEEVTLGKTVSNAFGYARLITQVKDGSLTLERKPLEGDELVSWHMIGDGSLVEMLIEAVNNRGPRASIHARSSGFMEAFPAASVTYNEAKVKA